MKTRTSLRTMFGEEMLPFVSTAAVLEGIGTETLLKRIRRQYREEYGEHLHASLLADRCFEWMHLNSARLQSMADVLGDRLINKTLVNWHAIEKALEERRAKILALSLW